MIEIDLSQSVIPLFPKLVVLLLYSPFPLDVSLKMAVPYSRTVQYGSLRACPQCYSNSSRTSHYVNMIALQSNLNRYSFSVFFQAVDTCASLQIY